MVRKTDLLNQKACKLPLFSSFCGGSVITLAGIWEPHGGFPRHGHRDTHHPPQHTRPPHTHLLTHSHTHTLSLSLSLTHTHTHTHLHPHPPSHPCPEGFSLAQMIRSRLLTARVAAGRWWTDQQPDCSQIAPGQGQGLSAFCEVVSRKAPWELPV